MLRSQHIYMLFFLTFLRYVSQCYSLFFGRDHLRSPSGIISGPGSFVVRSRDHLRTRTAPASIRALLSLPPSHPFPLHTHTHTQPRSSLLFPKTDFFFSSIRMGLVLRKSDCSSFAHCSNAKCLVLLSFSNR